MKLSIKHSSIAMAICASLYLVFLLLLKVPTMHAFMCSHALFERLPQAILLLSMITMGLSVCFNAHQLPTLSPALRRQALVIGIVTMGMLIYNLLDGSIYICGFQYFYWQSSWVHIVMSALAVAWLWQYAFLQTSETYQSKLATCLGAFVATIAALLLVFMFVSFVHVLWTGHVAGFRTAVWMSWLRPVSLLALFGTCLYGEMAVPADSEAAPTQSTKLPLQYSKFNRIIAWSSVIGLALLIIIRIIGCVLNWFSWWYGEDCYWFTVIGFVHMSWIGSVITMLLEKQLPKWHRLLNILAPVIINGVVVLICLLSAFIPSDVMYCLDNIITEDIPMIGIIISAAFIVVVWLINTILVLRAELSIPSTSTYSTHIAEEKH